MIQGELNYPPSSVAGSEDAPSRTESREVFDRDTGIDRTKNDRYKYRKTKDDNFGYGSGRHSALSAFDCR